MPTKPSRKRKRASTRKRAASAELPSHAASITPREPQIEPRNHRELAEAIFAKCNPVEVGCDLLESSSEKGASVRARVFETLADWQFGPQQRPAAPSTDRPAVRIIWDLPCPPREREYRDAQSK